MQKQEHHIRQFIQSTFNLIISAFRVRIENREDFVKQSMQFIQQKLSLMLMGLVGPLFPISNQNNLKLLLRDPQLTGVGFQNLALYMKRQEPVQIKQIFNLSGKQYVHIKEGFESDQGEEDFQEQDMPDFSMFSINNDDII